MDIKEDKKKYQAATYINEESLHDIKHNKKRLQSKIIFFVVCSISVALLLAIIGYIVYRQATAPTLEKMMNYMEEKYGEEFEVIAVNTQTETSSRPKIQIKSYKFPNDIITVSTYRKDGKRVYEDSYIPILRRDEFNLVYQELVSEVYKNSKTYVDSVASYITLPTEIDKKTKIEDILSNHQVNICISAYVVDDESKKEEQMEQLRLMLKEKRWDTTVDICYVDEAILNKLTYKNRVNILGQKGSCYLYGSMIMSDDFEVTDIEWSDGND